MGFVNLYFNRLGSCMVSWDLGYNSVISNAVLISFTINYKIVFITLEMFYCDRYISIPQCNVHKGVQGGCLAFTPLDGYLKL